MTTPKPARGRIAQNLRRERAEQVATSAELDRQIAKLEAAREASAAVISTIDRALGADQRPAEEAPAQRARRDPEAEIRKALAGYAAGMTFEELATATKLGQRTLRKPIERMMATGELGLVAGAYHYTAVPRGAPDRDAMSQSSY